jgi:DedD protein
MGRRARRGRGALWSLIALVLVAIPGFALGLFAGVLWEDPGLILGDLAGNTQEVPWGPPAPGSEDAPAPEQAPLAAATPETATPEPAPAAAAQAPAVSARTPDVAAPPPAAPRAVPSAERASAPAAKGRLSVQVGAFGDSRAAEQLADKLRGTGLPVYVSPSAAAEGAKRWRVRVGPIATREEADRIAARLKSKEKLPTWVLAEDGT